MSTEQPPTEYTRPTERVHVPSLVLVNTGDGKGKSTAAFGTLLRAVARNWRCGVVQFIKSGTWRVGEEKVCRQLGVAWWTVGDGFTWESDDLDRSRQVAEGAWAAAKGQLASGDYELLVLDEVTYPMNWGWIDREEVLDAIRNRAEHTTVICTGRDAPAGLVEVADTVTEMRKVKHAYDRKIFARRGIDY